MSSRARPSVIALDAILAVVGAKVEAVRGSVTRTVTGPASLDVATADHVSFCSQRVAQPLQRIRASRAGVVICSAGLPVTEDDHRERTLVLVQNPRLAFIRVMRAFFHDAGPDGVHPTAVIDAGAVLHPPTRVGPYCHIGADVEIDVDTSLLSHVVVHPHATIGARVRINAGAIIGADGFGYERNARGELERFEQVGRVVIEDDVEIGAHVVINRGTLGNTVIGRGSKINHLVNIGHNVVIGEHVFVAVGSIIAGSARVGHHCWIAPGVIVRDGVSVGNRAMLTMGAVVVRDIPDDVVVAGVPARTVPSSTPGA